MMKKKRYLFWTILFALLVISVMVMIFCFSAENGSNSTATSNAVTQFVLKLIKPDYDSMTGPEKSAFFAKVAHIIRKLAHFTEYFLLGLFSSLLLVSVRRPSGKSVGALFVLPVLFAALYAVFDEGHQRFIQGRAAQVTDVLIDTAGALAATLLVALFYFLARKRQK